MNSLARRPVTKSWRTSRILKHLGLPRLCRWEEAAPKIKNRIVSARRSGNDSEAAEWSAISFFLRKKLRHLCACGSVISGRQKSCLTCCHAATPKRRGTKIELIKQVVTSFNGTFTFRDLMERLTNHPKQFNRGMVSSTLWHMRQAGFIRMAGPMRKRQPHIYELTH